jgi:hypothetical protein
VICFINSIKIYIKIYIKTAPTYFGAVTPSSGSALFVFAKVTQKTLMIKKIKFYNTLALPVLLNGSETWTVKARDTRRITAAEMKYLRITAGYIWSDHKTNAQIAKELKVTQILDNLLEYMRNWIQRANRMPRNRLPSVMKHYSPAGRRNHGRLLKRVLGT